MIITPRPKTIFPFSIIIYLTGHIITMAHFLKNLIFRKQPVSKIPYPEIRRQYSNNFRGRHWLRTRENGSVACVACFMCSTNCPAQCIHIEAAESLNLYQEKYPKVFEIDLLRCVFCGYCVDACPCNVIYMTRDDELATFTRKDSIVTLKELIEFPERVKENPVGWKPFDGQLPQWEGVERFKY